jgi:hypothetical protein
MPGPLYADDAGIADSADLWRRLIREWVVPDSNTGGIRISSAAFDDSRDGTPMSVLLADIVAQTRQKPEEVLAGFAGYGLAAITAGAVRVCKQGVMPTPEPDEPAHASVFGPKTGSTKKGMAKAARLLIYPEP